MSANQPTCRHHFPQSVDILHILSQDIGSTNSAQYNAWSLLLNYGSTMENNHSLMASLAQASAALLILSIFLNLSTLLLAFRYYRRTDLLNVFIAMNYVDALLVLGPAIMWTYMVVNATAGTGDSVGYGLGIIFLWLSLLVKVVVDKSAVRSVFRSRCCQALRPGSPLVNRVNEELEYCECCITWEVLRLLCLPAVLERRTYR
jgi:hypothetical protein